MQRIYTVVVFSLLVLAWACRGQGRNSCTPDGWFGSNCQYKCHCQDNSLCDKTTGCPETRCERGWFGPACQYVDVASSFGAWPTPYWLVNSDDTTCKPATIYMQQVIVYFDRQLPFTWLRLHVNQSDALQLFTVTFLQSSRGSSQSSTNSIGCTRERRGTISDTTLDIHCDLKVTVRQVILSGQGVNYLCSLFISGGRNVALKQRTNQSSTAFNLPSENAVDGNTDPTFDGRSCTHTERETDSKPTWFITFVMPVKINRYVLYNRQDCCPERLQGFILKGFNSQTVVFNYTDQTSTAQNTYIITNPNNTQVAEVNVQATKPEGTKSTSYILTLCETEMYGDTVCSSRSYGRECEHRCNCVSGCFPSTGQCSECGPGYTGDACNQPCPSGTYGPSCGSRCSGNCKMSGSNCNSKDGSCSLGCTDGYTGRTCNRHCKPGKYGKDCNLSCSLTCLPVEDNTNQSPCHHVHGMCTLGCQAGYEGDQCLTQKQVAGDEGQDDLPIVAIIVPIVIVIALIVAIVIGVLVWRRRNHSRTPDSNQSMPPTYKNPRQENKRQFSDPESKISSQTALKNAQSIGEAQFEEAVIPVDHYENVALSVELTGISPIEEKDGPGQVKPQLTVPPVNPKPQVTKRTRPRLPLAGKEAGESMQTEGPYYNTLPAPSSTCIAATDLDAFMLSHSKEFFNEQFCDIPANKDATTEAALGEENKMKNRHTNIYAYDHSRVHLLEDSKKGNGGYIDASYVKGFNGQETFISSQDPIQAILVDFIRMLWEQSVEQIVMLTNVEEGTMTCESYWPEKGEMEVGEIKVRLRASEVFADYTIRSLQLIKQTGEPAKEVTQFHFTTWTDKEVPPAPWGLVDFELRVASYHTDMPIVVHCSNGVGRTGTFIALRNIMRQAEITGQMDFFTTVQKLRVDRINMEQYEFLHKAARAAMSCVGTTMTPRRIQEQVESLAKSAETGETKMEREFQIICHVSENCEDDSLKPTMRAEEGSKKTTNKSTDRIQTILPKEPYRVRLVRESDELGDYINAVFASSFTKQNQQILTRLPLPTTVTDFWRMVSQCQVSLIVAFDVKPAKKDLTLGEYLPKDDGKPTKFPPFCIEAGPTCYETLFETKKVIITADAETTSRMSSHACFNKECHVTHLTCKLSDLDAAKLLALAVEIRLQRPVGQERILFMCRNGADYSGLMCVILALLDRMDHDHYVSVPLVVGALKAIRPQVIPTLDQYKLLYEILRLHSVMGRFYSNVSDTQTDKTVTDGLTFEGPELNTGRVGYSFL